MHQGLQAGTLLRDRYEILGLIGQGGMGAVYKASDRRLPGRLCAIKEIWPPAGSSDQALATAREQFLQEASILARLDHPNLPKVSDFFAADPSIAGAIQPTATLRAGNSRDYLVMDYIPGQDLRQMVQQARREGQFLDERDVLGWMEQLCDTLAYLHHQDPAVLHRDVKPDNVKLTPEGRIKLVDFGLVKPLDPEDPQTVTGLRGIGSLPYTPIEQYAGDVGHTDVRSDLYSLGATLYQLVTGRQPASAQDRFLDPEVLTAPREINPALSTETEQAILLAMALHPNDRPESVEAWSRILRGGAVTIPVELQRRPASWGQVLRANLWLLLLALAAISVAIILTFR